MQASSSEPFAGSILTPLPFYQELSPFELPSEEEPTEKGPRKKSALTGNWGTKVYRDLADPLAKIFCPILFMGRPQELWFKSFLIPVVDALMGPVAEAIATRHKKGLDNAIKRAVDRAITWMLQQWSEEILRYSDDSIEDRCRRWRHIIAGWKGQLPRHEAKKVTWPEFIVALRYEEVLRWCQQVDEERKAQGLKKKDSIREWLADHPRPSWWPNRINVEDCGWWKDDEKESGKVKAALDICGQLHNLRRDRVRILKQRGRKILTPAVLRALDKIRLSR